MTVSRSNIMNETSERLDFSEDEIKELKNKISNQGERIFAKRGQKSEPFSYFLLDADCEESNLDLIIPTCAISFPNSPNAKTTVYG